MSAPSTTYPRRISSLPVPGDVRANFDLEGERVSGIREVRLRVRYYPPGHLTAVSAAEG
jgi:hypothetical protein